jgi:hypothetical protein
MPLVALGEELPRPLREELRRRLLAGWTGKLTLDVKEGLVVGYELAERTRL